jgi:hypothetical protein
VMVPVISYVYLLFCVLRCLNYIIFCLGYEHMESLVPCLVGFYANKLLME